MQRRLPPLNSLRAFEAAARLGSFKQAAAELHVTHGAVSRHVQVLENWLGVPMFRRLNRRVALTEAGKSYLAEVGAAFDRIALAPPGARANPPPARERDRHPDAAVAHPPALVVPARQP